MKFQFNYPRKKFHCLCLGKRQKVPTPEPQGGASWHRRLRNCLPHGDLSLPANYIVTYRDERTVQRDSSQTPHFPSSCKTLITCFQLEPCLSSWKSQAFLWKDCSALSLYFVWHVMWSLFSFWSQMRSLHNFPLENHEAREPLNPTLPIGWQKPFWLPLRACQGANTGGLAAPSSSLMRGQTAPGCRESFSHLIRF